VKPAILSPLLSGKAMHVEQGCLHIADKHAVSNSCFAEWSSFGLFGSLLFAAISSCAKAPQATRSANVKRPGNTAKS